MTDRLKGYLVVLERDIREDDAEPILEALKMIKGVMEVKPYVTKSEDSILEIRTKNKMIEKFYKFIEKELRE